MQTRLGYIANNQSRFGKPAQHDAELGAPVPETGWKCMRTSDRQ